MGSLPSPPRQPQQHVIAVFCDRYPDSNTSNWLQCYDPSTNSWRHLGQIPGLRDNHVLKGFALVSIQNCIYIIGGRLCHKKRADGYGSDPDEIVEVDVQVLATVLRYNVGTDEWSTCAQLDTPRFDFACTMCDNKIYVAGGQCKLGSPQGTSSVEEYDPTLDIWTQLPNMNTVRYKCVGVTWQGKIHVVGGFSDISSNIYSPVRSSAEVFNMSCGQWNQVGIWRLDVPPNQIVPVNGRLFSSGDCLNAWKGHIETYDDKLNIWNMVDGSQLQTLSCPRPTNQRLYLTVAPIGTHLYFLAGYRLGNELVRSISVVHRFDTSANANGDPWRSFEPMEEDGDRELCSHCCVVQL